MEFHDVFLFKIAGLIVRHAESLREPGPKSFKRAFRRSSCAEEGAGETNPARRKLWRVSSCFWPSQIFVPSSAGL
jgi:hypothetical protein